MKNVFFCIILWFPLVVFSQQIEVNGQIQDDSNLEVPFASVVLKSKTDTSKFFGTVANENGKFSLEVPKDNYTLEISVVGIQPKVIDLDATKTSKVINLGAIKVSTEVSLDEVEIRSTKNAYKINVDKKTYNVAQDLTAKGGTLSQVLQNIPSVQVENEGNISIRGNQNVKILVDGKPSGLASSADLFSTIPASSIEKVEVITNPSAKYTAQGTAGIINVILKKGKKNQFNSSIEVFTGHLLRAGVNGNISKNTETGSWYANVGLGYSKPKAVNSISLYNVDKTVLNSDQNSERQRKQFYYLVNLGGTKDFNTKSSITGSITYRRANADNENSTFYNDYFNNALINASVREDNEDEKNNFLNVNTTFTHKFSEQGHQLSLYASGDFTDVKDNASIFGSQTFPTTLTINEDATQNKENTNKYIISTDYTLPLKKDYKLDFGARTTLSTIKNDYKVERIIAGEPTIIPEFTNITDYSEDVYAFYGEVSKKIEKLAIKIGLRTEISDIKISSENNRSTIDKNYTDWFPSAFFTYSFSDTRTLQLAFSRRINRPTSWMIVPFSTFTDERNIFVGNQNINPSYVLGTELSFTNKFSNTFSLYPTLYYRKTTDEMEFFVEKSTIDINNQNETIFTSTIANIGDYYAYGLELGASYKPLNWWNMYAEINLNGFKQIGEYRGADFNGEGLLVSARYNSTFNIYKSMKLQLQNYYRGPISTGQYQRKGFYVLNIGLSTNILKNNGSLTLNISDVFNTNKRLVTTFGNDFTRDLDLQYRVRQINLAFAYRFNQKNHKGKKGNQFDNFEIVN